MLNCVYGAAGAGKTEYMYEKIRENMRRGKKSFILVPEQASMDKEREMLSRLSLSSQMWAEVLTFSRLCNRVFSACGPLRLNYIDKAGKLFVTQRTMQNLEKKLVYYKRNVHRRGFAQMTASLISELKRYGVSPAALYEAAKSCKSEELSEKLSDIAAIYEEYDRLINEKYSDAEENLQKAIPSIKKSGLFVGEIFIAGFKSFTPVEHLAIKSLMEVSDVTVLLCSNTLNKTEGIFASAAATWETLKEDASAAKERVGETVFLKEEQRYKENPELSHLKNNYFLYPANIYKEETQNISLVFAKDNYDEVRRAAQIIARLCREENKRYGDFLILVRNAKSYGAAIKAVFKEYNIGLFMNEQKSLSSSTMVKKVLSAAEILAYGFSYERIMPIVRFSTGGYTADEADIFENYILAASITPKYWQDSEDWRYNPDERRISLETVNKVKRASVNPINELKNSIKGRKTVAQLCRALLNWIKSERLDEAMSARVDEFNKNGEAERAGEYIRAWNAFSAVISQFEDCMGEEEITYERFYELLRAACDEVKLSIAPPMNDRVTVAEIDTFRAANAKITIALGMSDGVFPKGYIEDGMLSDAERDALSSLGIETAPTAQYKRKEEQTLIYSVLTSPKEKLFLSVPLGDKEGKGKARSEIIDRVFEIFPNIKIDEETEAESPSVILKELLGALFRVRGDKERLTEREKLIYDFFADKEETKEELKSFIKSAKNYSPSASLSKETAAELYGKKLMLSVSKLEKYNSCAFSYFLRYGLLAKERQKAGFESNSVGSVLHEALERYLKELKESNADYGAIKKSDCLRRIGEITKEAAQKSDALLYEASPYMRFVTERLKAVAAATAWEIVRFYANSSYRPYGFEVKIGGDGAFAGTKINLGEAEAEIEGFIDRIDMAEIDGEKYINIVDYKSSAKSTDETLEEAGVRIQPLIYAAISCKNLKANPSGMMYIHMNEPMLKFDSEPSDELLNKERQRNIAAAGIVLGEEKIIEKMDSRESTGEGYIPHGKSGAVSREEMQKRIENAEEKAYETAAKIVSGDISITPYVTKKYNPCRYCDYFGICGKKRSI